MRPALGLFAISVLAVQAHADNKAPPPKAEPGAVSDRAAMLAPIQIDSLTLTPLVATSAAAGKELDVLVLDEAMASKQVKISERDRESVNDLTLINTSDRPVFLLAGEVIIGGKQDRIIGANTVIPAKTTQSVPAFCVEHGRWDNSGKSFSSAKALAHGRLRGKASFESQGEVWQEVAAKNDKRRTKNATDTYRTVATQQSDGTLKEWEKKVHDALAKLPAADRARMVGYVIALNGKVATVDMFESPALFKKLEPKLLRSYMTEAVDVAAAKNIVAPTATDVKEFIADAEKATEEQQYRTKASSTKIKKGMKAGKASVDLESGTEPAKPMYKNYQSK